MARSAVDPGTIDVYVYVKVVLECRQ